MSGTIHVGTSGWSYQHWRTVFYPRGLSASNWLAHYATVFDTTEINGSFYRLPSVETVAAWTQTVPENFVFCPKMSRYLTHLKKLKDAEEPLERFFTVFAPMEAQLGPVLLQLPPMLPFHYDAVERFYNLLRSRYRRYRFVMEVRHESWLLEPSLTLMAGHEIGFVISQSGAGFPYAETVTATDVYVRMHGPAELYASAYSKQQLQDLADQCRQWSADGHAVWVYFNNDIHAHAVRDAQRLQTLLQTQ